VGARRIGRKRTLVKPMLCRTAEMRSVNRYLEDDNWWAQQKLDGDRLVVHVVNGKVSALNRDGQPRSLPVPAAVLRQFAAFPDEWVFDGELMATGEYLMFDLPFAASLVRPEHPYSFRFEVLERLYSGPVWQPDRCLRLLPPARTTPAKRTLLAQLRARGAEGLVLRHVDGSYRPGKRSDRALKAKFLHTADVIVDEVGVEGRNNCTFRLFRSGELVPAGSCSLEARPRVRPGDVIEVRYLYASDTGLLYQPVMMRVRRDKSPIECDVDQLQFTDRTVVPIQPYVRQRRTAKTTGTVVSVLDATHPDSTFDPAEGRWVTVCEHGSHRGHQTLRLARQDAATPALWCDRCAA
jgi:bifunctional non-homologous end joining protein LigD